VLYKLKYISNWGKLKSFWCFSLFTISSYRGDKYNNFEIVIFNIGLRIEW